MKRFYLEVEIEATEEWNVEKLDNELYRACAVLNIGEGELLFDAVVDRVSVKPF